MATLVPSGYQPSTRTVADVMRNVKRQFGDESGVQLEDADIIAWTNDGQRDIAERTDILKGKSTMTATAGTATYRWPTAGILSVDAIHYNGVKIPNIPFLQAEQEVIGVSTGISTGTPFLWYEWGGEFTFYPVPSATGTIDLYYSQIPAKVTQATDTLSVPDRYFNTLVHYVMQQTYEMDEDWQAASAKQQSYTESLQTLADDERDSSHMTNQVVIDVVGF